MFVFLVQIVKPYLFNRENEVINRLTTVYQSYFNLISYFGFNALEGILCFRFRYIVTVNNGNKGSSLFVSRENAVSLEENEYYIADLIGMEVFTEEGHFGIVKDVMETGANEVYIIDSDVHGEVLVPAIKQCIENVDVENGKMQIRLLEGLIG